MIKEYYPDPESAIEAVRIGHAWGAIYFTENFTDALVARMALGKLTQNNKNNTLLMRINHIY